MFVCRRCSRQAVRAVAQANSLPIICGDHSLATSTSFSSNRRPLSTQHVPPLAPEDVAGGVFPREPSSSATSRFDRRPHQRRQDVPPKDELKAVLPAARPTSTQPSDIKRTHSLKSNKSLNPRNLHSELRYLKDPLELAKHVEYTLKQRDEEKALALVRMSSRAVANIVSWNHVIKYQLANEKQSRALETYNDLKKRGLQPDSHTYLILLDGLAKNAHNPKALGRALSIYHSLNAPKSKAAPSIMHTNAVLKVCSRARDLDSMWDIFSKLPERGPHAPDPVTYTTILNALLYNVTQSLAVNKQEMSSEQAAAVEQAIVQGKTIWSNVVSRWRDDGLPMQEALVCAMGRLLLNGSRPRDWDDVFSLLQQTMGIGRLTPRLAPHSAIDQSKASFDNLFTDDIVADSKQTAKHRRPRHALPSNNTLSLIVATCIKSFHKDAAADYWSLLTDQNVYAVTPDAENFHVMLRLLRLSRSSSDALNLVSVDMPKAKAAPQPKTFRLALNVCERAQQASGGDPKPWEDALKLTDHMRLALPEPDPTALATFLNMTRNHAERERSKVDRPHHSASSSNEAPNSGPRAQQDARERTVAIYLRALDLTDRCMPAIRNVVALGSRSRLLDQQEYSRACLERLLPFLEAALERVQALQPNSTDATALERRRVEAARLRASVEGKKAAGSSP